MIPPIFAWAKDSSAVVALLGSNPTRLWPFNQGPHANDAVSAAPYALWQVIYGAPANYIGTLPDSDNVAIQFDCYATSASSARSVMESLRGALEPHGIVTNYNGEDRDAPTGLYRCSMSMEFWTDRTS